MGACSISSLRTFCICRGPRFVTIPANIKKSYYKLCCKQINVYFIFIINKIIIKANINSFGAKFQTTFVVCFSSLTNYRLKRSLYVKLKDGMSNSVDSDETAHMSRLIWIHTVCKSLLLSPDSESKKITLLFDFTRYIENLLNFSIPLSHVSM